MQRPTLEQTYMKVAEVMSERATCPRRKVGAVIVDADGYILSTGYNGQPRGFVHCSEDPCDGAHHPSGHGLEACEALHAEQNAIARLKEPFAAKTLYCTTAPCVACTKLALATGIETIIFKQDYPNSGRYLWLKANRNWNQI